MHEAADIPEKLTVNINDLELNGSITVAQLELPARAKVFEEPGKDVVQCVEMVEELEVEAEVGEAEPEVIGRKKEDEEAES